MALYRRSGVKIGRHLPGWPDARIVPLDHTGAKSGAKRTSPLMYHEDGAVIAVVASKGGQRTNLAWFHNLEAHPDTTIQIGSLVREVRARIATDEERDRLWPKFVAFYPGYEFFKSHAKGRKIPIVILDTRYRTSVLGDRRFRSGKGRVGARILVNLLTRNGAHRVVEA